MTNRGHLDLDAVLAALNADFNDDVRDVTLSWTTANGTYTIRQDGRTDSWSSSYQPLSSEPE
jgi:hypothetical protein